MGGSTVHLPEEVDIAGFLHTTPDLLWCTIRCKLFLSLYLFEGGRSDSQFCRTHFFPPVAASDTQYIVAVYLPMSASTGQLRMCLLITSEVISTIQPCCFEVFQFQSIFSESPLHPLHPWQSAFGHVIATATQKYR